MSYRTLRQCVDDLAATGRLVHVEEQIDPQLEVAEIQRRVFRAGGPAIYFAWVKGCRFPDGLQSVRHDGASAVYLSRFAR